MYFKTRYKPHKIWHFLNKTSAFCKVILENLVKRTQNHSDRIVLIIYALENQNQISFGLLTLKDENNYNTVYISYEFQVNFFPSSFSYFNLCNNV